MRLTGATRWADQDRLRQFNLGHDPDLVAFKLSGQIYRTIEITRGERRGILRHRRKQTADLSVGRHVPFTITQVISVQTVELDGGVDQLVEFWYL